jgi:riboflavin kinase/FMN adenylyltransferase
VDGRTVVTIGTFDGVHVGHQRILKRVDREARERGGARVANVFALPPRMTLEPDALSDLLLPVERRERLLRAFVDRVVFAEFSDVRQLSPQAFAQEVIVESLNARAVVVGEGFRFGRDRSGDLTALRSLGEALGFAVQSVPALLMDGEPVSSTRIRGLLREGRVRDAAHLLGRPPLLVGDVVHGEHIGRTLGHPTANLHLDSRILLPGDGIYYSHVYINESSAHGLLYVGSRPTAQGRERRSEVHLLSPPEEDLYGLSIEVHILERLRGDRAFPSLDALREEIECDVKAARALVARHPLPGDRIRG